VSWVDVVIIALCVSIAALEAKRGFTAAALDLAGLVIVTLLVTQFSSSVAGSMSPGVAYGVLWVFLAAAVITVVKFINDATRFDIGAFDTSLAGVLGLCSGVAVSYALCEMLNRIAGGAHAAVTAAALAPEVHDFRTFRSIIGFFRRLGE
jgi:hypothetical protein